MLRILWGLAGAPQRALRVLGQTGAWVRRTPRFFQPIAVLSAAVVLSFSINWIYQVARKPSELLFPVSGTLNKTPSQTWRQYGWLFEKYATPSITPELLAALAQVEGAGNPVSQTYWRWSWTPWPFEVYRPASSSVGMYQITDGAFAEARHYCIREHMVIQESRWNDWDSCWFNGLYTRVLPSHAVQLAAISLDRGVASALQHHAAFVSTAQKQQLAAVIHLCGAGAGALYVRNGLRLSAAQRCGVHSARDYVLRVTMAMGLFKALRTADAQLGEP